MRSAVSVRVHRSSWSSRKSKASLLPHGLRTGTNRHLSPNYRSLYSFECPILQISDIFLFTLRQAKQQPKELKTLVFLDFLLNLRIRSVHAIFPESDLVNFMEGNGAVLHAFCIYFLYIHMRGLLLILIQGFYQNLLS